MSYFNSKKGEPCPSPYTKQDLIDTLDMCTRGNAHRMFSNEQCPGVQLLAEALKAFKEYNVITTCPPNHLEDQ